MTWRKACRVPTYSRLVFSSSVRRNGPVELPGEGYSEGRHASGLGILRPFIRRSIHSRLSSSYARQVDLGTRRAHFAIGIVLKTAP